jgi:hypothetical protein
MRILVVEDDERVATFIQMGLEEEAMRSMRCTTAARAERNRSWLPALAGRKRPKPRPIGVQSRCAVPSSESPPGAAPHTFGNHSVHDVRHERLQVHFEGPAGRRFGQTENRHRDFVGGDPQGGPEADT